MSGDATDAASVDFEPFGNLCRGEELANRVNAPHLVRLPSDTGEDRLGNNFAATVAALRQILDPGRDDRGEFGMGEGGGIRHERVPNSTGYPG